ncbi:MAG: hypothetical protein AAGE96_24195 [Cyanobacteria bacterium P01_G01_bin.19]
MKLTVEWALHYPKGTLCISCGELCALLSVIPYQSSTRLAHPTLNTL